MKKNYILFLLIFTAFLFFLIKTHVVYAENPVQIEKKITKNVKNFKEISITPFDEIKQGQTIFIKITAPQELKNPVFKFKEKTYPIFKTKQNKYCGMLGINVFENPGKYKISLSDDSGFLNDKAFINIISREFPMQNIVLSKKMSGLSASAHELNQIGKAKYTVTDKFLRSNIPYNSPTNGCINSVFGLKRYYNGEFSGNYHKGIDIKASEGEPVRSITDGTVIIAEKFRLHGGTVAIDHGQGLVSIYIHLSKIDVQTGDSVTADQKIGEVGSTGFATGPHLHWGLYVNGISIDPMENWIKPVNICK